MPDEQPDEPVTPAPVPEGALEHDASPAPDEPAAGQVPTPEAAAHETPAGDDAGPTQAGVPDDAGAAGVDAGRVAPGPDVPDDAGAAGVDAGPVAPGPDVPDEETLARIAAPARVRRAPRFGAFIGYGAVLGFVVGVVLAIALDRGDLVAAGEGGGVLPFLGGSNGARLVTGFGLAGVGAIVGAVLALWADARSRRAAR